MFQTLGFPTTIGTDHTIHTLEVYHICFYGGQQLHYNYKAQDPFSKADF